MWQGQVGYQSQPVRLSIHNISVHMLYVSLCVLLDMPQQDYSGLMMAMMGEIRSLTNEIKKDRKKSVRRSLVLSPFHPNVHL